MIPEQTAGKSFKAIYLPAPLLYLLRATQYLGTLQIWLL